MDELIKIINLSLVNISDSEIVRNQWLTNNKINLQSSKLIKKKLNLLFILFTDHNNSILPLLKNNNLKYIPIYNIPNIILPRNITVRFIIITYNIVLNYFYFKPCFAY